ncbi:UBD domain-containing protein [Psidium guajava]|nr:UBD domain-containing protein [Psidium guajava]
MLNLERLNMNYASINRTVISLKPVNISTFNSVYSSKKIRKPKPWKHPEPITRTQLMKMREEFWDTAPHYGGRPGILTLLG